MGPDPDICWQVCSVLPSCWKRDSAKLETPHATFADRLLNGRSRPSGCFISVHSFLFICDQPVGIGGVDDEDSKQTCRFSGARVLADGMIGPAVGSVQCSPAWNTCVLP